MTLNAKIKVRVQNEKTCITLGCTGFLCLIDLYLQLQSRCKMRHDFCRRHFFGFVFKAVVTRARIAEILHIHF